ncbi:hypothetical protein EON65_34580 [archaeon]|nr:MAG: hypothetical protein EON65_34580 [archaeon]
MDAVITEEQLLEVFSKYGKVADVIIKKYEIDPVSFLEQAAYCYHAIFTFTLCSICLQMHVRQSGYAFVHYLADDQGIDAALASVQELEDKAVGPIRYKCSISHKLQLMLKQKGRSFNLPVQNKAKGTFAYKNIAPAAYTKPIPTAPNAVPVAAVNSMYQAQMMSGGHMVAPAMGQYNPPLMMYPIYFYDQQTGNPVYCAPRLVNNNGTYMTYMAPVSPTNMQGTAAGYAQQPMMNAAYHFQQGYVSSPSSMYGYSAHNSSNPTSSDTATMAYEADYHQEQYGSYSPIYTNSSSMCVVSPSLSDGDEQANITDVDDQRYTEVPLGYGPNSAFEKLTKTTHRGSPSVKRESYANKVSSMMNSNKK